MSILRQALVSLVLVAASSAEAADGHRIAVSPDLCVVPVADGAPGERDAFSLHRLVTGMSGPRILEGLPWPIFYPMNRGGVWTVSPEHRFELYGGAFPRSGLYDEFAVEARSGRIVGVHGEVFVAARGERDFRKIAASERVKLRGRNAIIHVARRDATFIASMSGMFELRGEELVQVWGPLAPLSLSSTNMFDLPSIGGVFLSFQGGAAAIWRDNNALEALPAGDGNTAEEMRWARDIPKLGVLVVRASTRIRVFDVPPVSGAGAIKKLFEAPVSGPSHPLTAWDLASVATGDYLFFAPVTVSAPKGPFEMKRLTASGAEVVPGPKVEYPRSALQDIPSRRLALIADGDGLLVYDGAKLSVIPQSGPNQIGWSVRVHDLPSIGKVLVATTRGVFELTTERTLVPVLVAEGPDNRVAMTVAEMPDSKVAIVLQEGGIMAIDAVGTFFRVPGGERLELRDRRRVIGVIPIRNELLFHDNKALHLIVDKRSRGASACRAAN